MIRIMNFIASLAQMFLYNQVQKKRILSLKLHIYKSTTNKYLFHVRNDVKRLWNAH